MTSDDKHREILSLIDAFSKGKLSRRTLLKRLAALGVPAALAMGLASSQPLGSAQAVEPSGQASITAFYRPRLNLPPTPAYPPNLNPPDPKNPRFPKPSPRPSITVVFNNTLSQGERAVLVENTGEAFGAAAKPGVMNHVNIDKANAFRDRGNLPLEIANAGNRPLAYTINLPNGRTLVGTVPSVDVEIVRPWTQGYGVVQIVADAFFAGLGYAL